MPIRPLASAAVAALKARVTVVHQYAHDMWRHLSHQCHHNRPHPITMRHPLVDDDRLEDSIFQDLTMVFKSCSFFIIPERTSHHQKQLEYVRLNDPYCGIDTVICPFTEERADGVSLFRSYEVLYMLQSSTLIHNTFLILVQVRAMGSYVTTSDGLSLRITLSSKPLLGRNDDGSDGEFA
ncbi:hypothetical protein Syun_014421 [Stephania yunnanensis]|uniref:Uncharacterized protein n=1 Tax=Stephania yunnanensis TaxID=152371 RepID=A0AAP0JKD1_9MAGN